MNSPNNNESKEIQKLLDTKQFFNFNLANSNLSSSNRLDDVSKELSNYYYAQIKQLNLPKDADILKIVSDNYIDNNQHPKD